MTPRAPTLETIRQALQCGEPGCACGTPHSNVHCPAHEDTTPSLSVNELDGKILVKCFGGCSQDRVLAALKKKGLWPSSNEDRPQAQASKPRIVATYDYRDSTGKLIFQVCRQSPKSFRQRRPDGEGGWVWGLTAGDYYRRRPGEGDWFRVKRAPPTGAEVKHLPECLSILYRLPELLQADSAAPVLIEEGEADADNLAVLGLVATTNPGGAGKWREEFNEFFRGRHVVILPDNDAAGRKHAQQVAQHLHGIAVSVKVLTLSGLPEKGDVSDWLKAGGTKDQLLALADAAPEWAGPTEPENILALGSYTIECGRICQLKEVGVQGGGTLQIPVPLCNFVARCEEEVLRDNGLEQTLEFHLAGTLDAGQSLPLARVKASEFRGMGWVTRCWGMAATLVAGQAAQDKVREAIQRLSQGATRRTIFTHSGWRKLNGVWVYLHGGGGINAPTSVEVDLGPELARYCLPAPGGVKAARASRRFLDLGPWKVTAPILACVYLAPLADLLKVDFSLWLLGQSGVFKSTVAALALSHFGDFDRKVLPGNWGSTGNSLERRAFALKDCLFVIDDFAPPRNALEAHELERKAHRVCRAAGNRAGRGRLQADLSERPTYEPRSLLLGTGEILPSGQSLLARIFTVELREGDLDQAKLTAAQAEKFLYPRAMSAYIAWLAPRLEEVLAEVRESWENLRQAAQTGAHARVAEEVAWLAVGFKLFLDFQVELRSIQADEAMDLEDKAWRVFTHLGEVHGRRIEKEKPTLRFLHILRELFVQRRIYLKSLSGGSPENWEELGWEASGKPDPGAEFLGWSGDGFLYLMPDTAYRVVQEFLRRQNSHLGIGKNGLFRALAEEALLEPAADGENTRQKKIFGRNERVLFLRGEALGLEGSGSGSGG